MKRAIAAMLACLMLAGCADDNIITTENSGSTSRTTTEATSTTTPTTTSASTATTTPTPTATTTTATASATTADTTAAEPEEQEPSGNESITYETVSDGHIFVDFSYIEDYKGTRDISECGEWYDMAMTALKSSEAYTTYNTTLKNEDLSVIKYHESAFATDITDYLDENGDIQPILSGAYIDDFDKNGQNECFLLLDIPQYTENPGYWITRSYLYFVNSNGIKYLNDFSNICEISMLDYGLCRQFIIRAYGTMGADEGALLYGGIDGEVVKHYAFRGGFTKVDCFINASGWLGFGDFMYYDTVRQQYRAVAYEHIPTQTILEMDSTGEFAGYYDDYEIDPNSLPWYLLVGEKYYCLWLGPSDIGTPYIYENGRFEHSTDNVRVSHGLSPIKINYDDAVSSMLSPAEAAVVHNAL